MTGFTEQAITLRGVKIACKIWRIDAPIKVLALHGWLDNAASFDALAEQLDTLCIIAPDLAGQGLSDFRPASAQYHLWDDVLDCLLLSQHFNWQQFSIIGHSRGAMLASMLAASFPEKVNSLLLLDALMPLPVDESACVSQLRKNLVFHLENKTSRHFTTRQEALAIRAKASNFELALAEKLAERQLRQTQAGWYWHIDERLKAPSAIKLSAQHNQQFLQAISCPTKVILAEKGLAKFAQIQELQSNFPQFSWSTLAGHHHLHMTEKAKEIAQLCQYLFSSSPY